MTANPNQGWQVVAEPGVAVRRTEAGRFALTVHVSNRGQGIASVDMVLRGDQIEQIHASMLQLLTEGVPAQQSTSRRDSLDL